MFKPIARSPRDCSVSKKYAFVVMEVRPMKPGTEVKRYTQLLPRKYTLFGRKKLTNKGKTYFKVG